ncbi:hypothetical protein A7X61_02585 [Stenotrophomonas maltophilia]|nr:hypothetical protein A7X61_02585 [Stenotrophomonas maltophilia]
MLGSDVSDLEIFDFDGESSTHGVVSTKVDTYQQHSQQRIGWKAPLLFKRARRRRGDKVECAGSSAYAPSA